MHRRIPGRHAKIVIADCKAQGDRGNAKERTLYGTGDRAGIIHIVREVLAAIDPGEDEVWRLVFQEVAHTHDHAVGRGALDRVAALGEFSQAQGFGQGQRV